MEIILVPGLWLTGASWDRVVPLLEQAGHRTHPLTLPGMESREANRSTITRRDHVDAVVAAIDSIDPADGTVVLVGHSAGAAIAHAAVDARPDRIAHAIYVGGFPVGDGVADPGEFPTENGEIPLPDWSGFDDADLADLDDQLRAEFRRHAVPSPARAASDPQQLTDKRRYDVPVTVICPEFSSEMLHGWIAQDMAPVRELAKIREVEYVDLPTGHWPQFTRPAELAQTILARVTTAAPSGPVGAGGDPAAG